MQLTTTIIGIYQVRCYISSIFSFFSRSTIQRCG